jgi:hypothetical protein
LPSDCQITALVWNDDYEKNATDVLVAANDDNTSVNAFGVRMLIMPMLSNDHNDNDNAEDNDTLIKNDNDSSINDRVISWYAKKVCKKGYAQKSMQKNEVCKKGYAQKGMQKNEVCKKGYAQKGMQKNEVCKKGYAQKGIEILSPNKTQYNARTARTSPSTLKHQILSQR